jgi:hypothetical protein
VENWTEAVEKLFPGRSAIYCGFWGGNDSRVLIGIEGYLETAPLSYHPAYGFATQAKSSSCQQVPSTVKITPCFYLISPIPPVPLYFMVS